MTEKTLQINFDMDGTLANFYAVENWLEDLENENERPYKVAKPLLNLSALARQIHRLQKIGYQINIISWLSKTSTNDFDKKVIKAKNDWLKSHLPSVHFDNITIVSYGSPKSNYGNGILFDDEERNRKEWKGRAFDEKNILQILRELE